MARLRWLVKEAGGSIDGRKKLHKLVYICQYLGLDLDQSFVFHYYGVYSPSLAAVLDVAKEWNVLEESLVGDSYRIRLGSEVIEEEEAGLSAQAFDYSVLKELAGKSASTLEVLTTILYLYSNGYRGQALAVQACKDLQGPPEWSVPPRVPTGPRALRDPF